MATTYLSIINEAIMTASLRLHIQRARLAAQINALAAVYDPMPMATDIRHYKWADLNCISDATAAGATPLTTGNVDAPRALVIDAHIDAAVSVNFDGFFDPSS